MATNKARFNIGASPPSDPTTGDRGYVATNGEVLDLTLENPSGDIESVTYYVYDANDPESPQKSKNAPAITFITSGTTSEQPATTATTSRVTMPAAGVHSYLIRAIAKLAGGENHVYERLVVIRSASGQRKTVPAESTEFAERGWSDAQNEMVDGGSATTAPLRAAAFGQGTVAGVAATPGWQVIGAFVFDWSVPSGHELKLDALALVSQGALTCRLRLYDLTAAAEIASSVLSTTATSEARLTSADIVGDLVAGNIYQIQAECTGGALVTDFATVRYAMLRGD